MEKLKLGYLQHTPQTAILKCVSICKKSKWRGVIWAVEFLGGEDEFYSMFSEFQRWLFQQQNCLPPIWSHSQVQKIVKSKSRTTRHSAMTTSFITCHLTRGHFTPCSQAYGRDCRWWLRNVSQHLSMATSKKCAQVQFRWWRSVCIRWAAKGLWSSPDYHKDDFGHSPYTLCNRVWGPGRHRNALSHLQKCWWSNWGS